MEMSVTIRIQRSMLILPTHNSRFVEKAHLRDADAIVLDLEDSVPVTEKERARNLIRESIRAVKRGGADVLVRVNPEEPLLHLDLEAAVQPGVRAIFLPKVDSPQQVENVEVAILTLERERDLEEGSIKLALHVESPLGILNMREIAAVGARVESMSIGVDDYCFSLGIEPSDEGQELLLPLTMLVIACGAAGITPLGILGSVGEFSDLERFEDAAVRARNLGCKGAYCIHPSQVPILNRVFSPPPVQVDHAKRAVTAFEKGLEEGRAAVNLDGRMVDTPIYKRAKQILERAKAIEALERRKREALRQFGEQVQ